MILLAMVSMSASSNTTAGLLPPNSSVNGVKCSAAARAMILAIPPDPV
jgi:hypothetical protein